jgi:hypothetical protein
VWSRIILDHRGRTSDPRRRPAKPSSTCSTIKLNLYSFGGECEHGKGLLAGLEEGVVGEVARLQGVEGIVDALPVQVNGSSFNEASKMIYGEMLNE